MDQPSGVGVVQGVGDRGDQFRRLVKAGASLSLILVRQVAAFDELRDDEAETVVGATHVVDRHDVGMVQAGEDAGFVQVRLDILGVGDSFGVRHLDRDGAVEVVVVGQIDPPNPPWPKPSEDRVTPDLRGMEKREGFLRNPRRMG